MPRPLVLILTPSEWAEFEWARDYHAKPCVREQATALLKIADGKLGRWLALHGLPKEALARHGLRLGRTVRG